MDILSSIIYLSPIAIMVWNVLIAINQKDTGREIVHILWAMFFLLLFMSNQLERLYQ